MPAMTDGSTNAIGSSTQPPPGAARWRRRGIARAAGAIIAVLAITTAWYVWQICWLGNFHEVRRGELYRSAQLGSSRLASALRSYGIQSVINLRGAQPDADWFREQMSVVRDAGATQLDIEWSHDALPWPSQIEPLVSALENASRPILIHCWGGADRTGLACAIAELLAGAAPETARHQLSVRFGHLPIGPASHLDEFFALYQQALMTSSDRHSRDRFRQWLQHEYAPRGYRAEIVIQSIPDRVRPGESFAVSCLVRNPTQSAWQFHRGARRGIRMSVAIPTAGIDKRAGFFERTVSPGESIVLSVQLAAPRQPGRHELVIDLVDEGRQWFRDVGSPAVCRPLIVANK